MASFFICVYKSIEHVSLNLYVKETKNNGVFYKRYTNWTLLKNDWRLISITINEVIAGSYYMYVAGRRTYANNTSFYYIYTHASLGYSATA